MFHSTEYKGASSAEHHRIYSNVPFREKTSSRRQRRIRLFQPKMRPLMLAAGQETFTAPLGAGVTDAPIAAQYRKADIQSIGKRIMDMVGAAVALILLAPLMILTAIAIKIESRGPVFFCQTRTGLNQQPFQIWKFRSMYSSQADYGGAQQTSANDARVTRVGRVIRKLSIDELPQLFNVLQGNMALVGPRPHALDTKVLGCRLEVAVPNYSFRHRVKPGLTGWAQVNGLRGELDEMWKAERRVSYDLEYIDKWSLVFDIKILAKTVCLVLHDPAAY
jgi:exopolysaccharide biosynthesis polyprenyl glycosylphosphotransferase